MTVFLDSVLQTSSLSVENRSKLPLSERNYGKNVPSYGSLPLICNLRTEVTNINNLFSRIEYEETLEVNQCLD